MTGVALLHYSCPPVVGGVEEVVGQQARMLAQHGHAVRIVAGEGGTGDRREPVGRGAITVRLHPLLGSGAPEALAAADAGGRALEAATARVEAVLDEALDGMAVVFAHNVLSMPFNLPLTLAVRRIAAREGRGGVPGVVGWNHDSPYLYAGYAASLDEEPWRVLRDPHPAIRWVTISQARADELAELWGGWRPEVVPNGIDPHAFLKLDPVTTALVREERLLAADLVLVQPSRLHPRKNVELSLQVLRALRDRGVEARLLLTGAHDPHDPAARGYADRLRALADELDVTRAVVLLADHLLADGTRLRASRLAIRDLYQVADALFLPSRSEGFGLPVLEAGLIRLPIACADIPPLRELVGDTAYRFPLDADPGEIAEGLLRHLDASATHRLHRRVVPDHTWDHLYTTRIRPLLDPTTWPPGPAGPSGIRGLHHEMG